MMALGHRLRAVLRALFGPEPGPMADAARDERLAFDDRWREQEAALEVLQAELELVQRRQEWHREDVQGYSTAPGDGSD